MLSQTTTNPASVSLSQNVKAVADERTYDWGQIPYNGPDATKTFLIKNAGTDILKLTNIKTSCTCTSAQLTIDGNVSPKFGMHTTSSWVGEVPPGGQAQLMVVFDQDFHGPSGVGAVERLISVETNDVTNPRLEFSLKGAVVK